MRVGKMSEEIAALLELPSVDDAGIYIGPTNIEHMKARHPEAYERYGESIPAILNAPDYVGTNPSDGSVEYVKEFLTDGEYVKVAVRLSSKEKYFVRSLYTLNKKRTENFIAKGTLKKLTK